MRCSVVVPYFNRPKFVTQAVKSIQAQKGMDFEILVVDDGSETKPPKDVMPYVFNKPWGGCASAKNYGLRLASFDFVTICDDDDMLYDNNSLAVRAQALIRTGADMVYTDYAEINGDGALLRFQHRGPATKESILEDDIINGGTMMFRRGAWDKIGLYDEELLYDEDWDFKIRCVYELNCVYLPVVTMMTRYHPGQKTAGNRDKMKIDQEIMKARLSRKYGFSL